MSKSIKLWVARDEAEDGCVCVFRTRPESHDGWWAPKAGDWGDTLELGKVTHGLKRGDLKRATLTVDA